MNAREALAEERKNCSDMYMLKQAYKAAYGKDMAKVVQDDLSMKTKRLFLMALEGARMDEHAPLNHQLIQQDAHAIRSAAKGAGTDEITVRLFSLSCPPCIDTPPPQICGIFASRSTAHLQALSQAYQHQHRKTLADVVRSEFSGHMKDGLLYIANTALPGPLGVSRDAHLLEESMAGMGTKDERLIYRIMRAHWDRPRFEEVKRVYAATQHRKGLRSRVEGETSGDYKRFLAAVVGP